MWSTLISLYLLSFPCLLLIYPCRSILPEGKVILKPQMTRRVVGSLVDQQFILGQVRPAKGMGSRRHHLVDGKSLCPSKDVLNFNQVASQANNKCLVAGWKKWWET